MLTPAQLIAIKNDIIANSDLNIFPNNDDGNSAIAALYNLLANPTFRVWRTNVSTAEVKKAISWSEFIGRSQGERDAFALMVANHIVNAADANVRQGFSDIFSGPSGVTSRGNLTAISKRDATRIEKLLSTGTGSDASPATMGFEGSISYQDIGNARNS